MKTGELTGAQLDYWVARAEGLSDPEMVYGHTIVQRENSTGDFHLVFYHPSGDWAQGGPLIEKYQLFVGLEYDGWKAKPKVGVLSGKGHSPLVAICRAVVRAVYGDEVPDVAVL